VTPCYPTSDRPLSAFARVTHLIARSRTRCREHGDDAVAEHRVPRAEVVHRVTQRPLRRVIRCLRTHSHEALSGVPTRSPRSTYGGRAVSSEGTPNSQIVRTVVPLRGATRAGAGSSRGQVREAVRVLRAAHDAIAKGMRAAVVHAYSRDARGVLSA
jgi:hypothetical protein